MMAAVEPAVSRSRRRRRLRLRILLALTVVALALFAVSRMERASIKRFGPAAVAVYDVLAPPIDTEPSEDAKRFIADVRAHGGIVHVIRTPNSRERLFGQSEASLSLRSTSSCCNRCRFRSIWTSTAVPYPTRI
jgi:hypothetical protein